MKTIKKDTVHIERESATDKKAHVKTERYFLIKSKMK